MLDPEGPHPVSPALTTAEVLFANRGWSVKGFIRTEVALGLSGGAADSGADKDRAPRVCAVIILPGDPQSIRCSKDGRPPVSASGLAERHRSTNRATAWRQPL